MGRSPQHGRKKRDPAIARGKPLPEEKSRNAAKRNNTIRSEKKELPQKFVNPRKLSPSQRKREEDREVIYALRAMEILVDSGVGLSEAMKHIADEDYGCISEEFARILEETVRGKYLDKCIEEAVSRAASPAFKKMLEAMVMAVRDDIGISKILKKTADREFEERRTRLAAYTKKLTGTAEIFITTGILLPIILVVFGFLSSITESIADVAPFLDGGILGSMKVCTVPALLIVLAILLGLILSTRARDPNI
ncbi:MAG: type II secretion system F family protein [Candidatus Thermoplasmatota archaeon]|jgi:pilus assembly protein TadC|nr:type II secretion system F family protein [Candidatus Thermoplasmatota archaeon]MDP7264111.1 type II secretion system F family protein [Candidatus Thermoplasmatota archaeon]